MDEVTQSDIDRAKTWLEERTSIQQSINRIKIMLWARDYGRAQQELSQLEDSTEEFYESSLRLKADMTSTYREEKSELEIKYRQQRLKGLRLEHRVQEDMAKITRLQNPVNDSGAFESSKSC